MEACGVATDNGPCSMKKGHAANFHRHRTYGTTYWRIKAYGKTVEFGQGRVPLQYATTSALNNYDKVVIEVERG